MNPGHSDEITSPDSLALLYRPLGEVRVGRLQPTVIDRDGSIPDDHAAERDMPVVCCTNP